MVSHAFAGDGASGRSSLLAGFVRAQGLAAEYLQPLAADASFRRYWRLVRAPGESYVVMDAPPDREPVAPFVQIGRHLHALGFSAPRILAEDAARGFLLLEDLGDDTFTRLIAGGHDETALYELALDCLVALHREPAARAIALPAYDTAALLLEARLFTDWFAPAQCGALLSEAAIAAYEAAWADALAILSDAPLSLVLRDFHVDNILLLPSREGIARCGLLDFQDAVIGPAAYDLVSLIEDARRDIGDGLRAHLWRRYAAAFPERDNKRFGAQARVLAAQRHVKVAGIFVRLWLRDGKPGYLAHIPRVTRLLAACLDDPALGPVRAWLQRWLPAWQTQLADAETLRLVSAHWRR